MQGTVYSLIKENSLTSDSRTLCARDWLKDRGESLEPPYEARFNEYYRNLPTEKKKVRHSLLEYQSLTSFDLGLW